MSRWICWSLGVLLYGNACAFAEIDIRGTGFVIRAPGTYELEVDLNDSNQLSPVSIRIENTHHVLLQINGHRMTGRPNKKFGGQGTAIYMVNCHDVEIEGGGGTICNYANGIHLENCRNIFLDGDDLTIQDCAAGVMVIGSSKVHVNDIRFRRNRQRAVYLIGCTHSRVDDCDIRGPTEQGILLSGTTNTRIDDNQIGEGARLEMAILLLDSNGIIIDNNEIENSGVAIVLQGEKTVGNRIEDCQFRRNLADLQIGMGAQPPALDHNRPRQLRLAGP